MELLDKLKDEFCTNEVYQNGFDMTDDGKVVLVERIIITPNCQSDWKEAVVKKLVDEKLESIGINSLELKSMKLTRPDLYPA